MYNKEEAKQLRLDFWNEFDCYSKTLDYLRPNRGRWILYYTGIKNLDLKFEVLRNVVRVVLEVNYKDEDKRFDIYSQLEQYKNIIEKKFDGPLIWDYVYTTDSGNEVCRIYTEIEGYDFHCRSDWKVMFEFMANRMMRLEKAFKAIKDFIQSPE